MSKAALADAIKGKTDCTSAQASDAVDALTTVIAKTLKKEGSFSLVGFGTFKSAKRSARMGRNPRTGEAIKIAASKTVRFKPSGQLKGQV